MSAYYPCATLWDALDARGCDPCGPQHDFSARCPAHDDTDPSLSVREGVDRRALVHCFAGCATRAVLAALGLDWRDVFPAGHRKARRLRLQAPPPGARNATQIANTLAALDAAGIDWWLTVATTCAHCGGAGAWIRGRSGRDLYVDCPNGCGPAAFAQALAGRVLLAREADAR